MKDEATKRKFIELRAEGKSYRAIHEELGIAKATCSSWEKSLADQISEARRERLEELYTSYSMTREARIEKLGEIIQRIDEARGNSEKPLELIGEDRLLELRLKYERELQTLYKEPETASEDSTLDGLLEEYNRLYSEARSGRWTASEVRAQLSVLDAKRDTLYRIASEEEKEEKEDLASMALGYTSKLIRHEDEEEAI